MFIKSHLYRYGAVASDEKTEHAGRRPALQCSQAAASEWWSRRFRLRGLRPWLFAGALLLCGRPALAQLGLGLSPMRVELNMGAGTEYSGVLNLSSDSGARVRVRGAALDFLVDDNQTPQFEPRLASEAEFSCRDWVAINPVEAELDSGTLMKIRYTVRVPASAAAPRAYHCAIGIVTLPTSTQMDGNGIRTAVQVVSALYITLGHPPIEAQFKEIRLIPGGDNKGGWTGEIVLHNYSLTHIRPVGELSVLDSTGNVVESAPLVPAPALPRRDQHYRIAFAKNPGPGTYKLRARVDFGNNRIEEGTAVVRVEQ